MLQWILKSKSKFVGVNKVNVPVKLEVNVKTGCRSQRISKSQNQTKSQSWSRV
jgi:hypothetical protein